MKRQDFIKKTRSILHKRRAGLLSLLAQDRDQLQIERYPVGDAADRAIDSERDAIVTELASSESRELERIDDALVRMDEGLYGECEGCHKDIPLARLQALPFAVRCVECQRLAEVEGRRKPDAETMGGRWGNASLPRTAPGSHSAERELLNSSK
jgi:DnaK suppressor protein